MELTSVLQPPTIPWRRSWIVLAGTLVLPWLYLLIPTAWLPNGYMSFIQTTVLSHFLQSFWWGSVLALGFQRRALRTALLWGIGLFWVNELLLAWLGISSRNHVANMIASSLVIQVFCLTVIKVLRANFSLAHISELPEVAAKTTQFSLRAMLVVTLGLAFVAALIAASVREGRLDELSRAVPWLLLINTALLWNELLQRQWRLLNVGVCTLAWLGLWASAMSFASSEVWLLALTLTGEVFALPLAYRWAGWREIPREQPPVPTVATIATKRSAGRRR